MSSLSAAQLNRFPDGVREASGTYPILNELRGKGFRDAEPLSAVILELHLSLLYLSRSQDGEGRSKLSMFQARLSQASELLKAPQFENTSTLLQVTHDELASVCQQVGNARISSLNRAGDALKKVVELTVNAADSLLMEGFGPSPSDVIENLRHLSVKALVDRLRDMRSYDSASYLGYAVEAVYEGLLKAEAKDRAACLGLLMAAGSYLSDVERRSISPGFTAFYDHPHVDFRKITSGLHEVRDAIHRGELWSARSRFMGVVSGSYLV